jgi:hypothetical protein
MNQMNTLQYPTINGLKSLQLDNLTTDVLNAKNMFLESLEVADIVVDSKLTIGDDAVIETNGLEISNEELSYLDGATSNIQSQLGNLNTRVTQNEDDITELDTRVTQNEDDIILLEDKTVALTYDIVNVKTTINSKLDILGNTLINGVLTLGNITHTPGTNYVLNNPNATGSFKIQHYDSGMTMRQLLIDQFINVTGINDLYAGRMFSSGVFTLGNITHTPGTSYIINNPNATGTLTIRHYDGSMVMRQLLIDQFINVSGINDLYSNKLYIGGSLIDFTSYNTTRTNTQKISYDAGTDTTTISSKVNVTGKTTLSNDIEIAGTGNLIIGATTISQTELSYLDGASSQAFMQGTDAVSIQFIGSANPWDGWTYKSLLNNFYINWWSRNTSGVDVNTFRLHHTKISSLIAHEFLDNISLNSTTHTNRQVTASYHNFSSSSIPTPTYVSRIYATSGVSDSVMLFEQTSS